MSMTMQPRFRADAGAIMNNLRHEGRSGHGETAACVRRLPPRLARPPRGTAGGAPPHSRPGGGVAVRLGGGGDVLPKERGEVTLIRAPDLGTDVDEGQVGLGQQLLGARDPALAHVLVRRQPGGALEEARKVGRAHLRHSGELDQGQRVRQMRQDIGDRAMQRRRGETAVARLIEVPVDGKAAEEVDRQCMGQGLGIQTTSRALGFDGGLQDQRHMVQEGVTPGQVGYQLSVVHGERCIGGMHEQGGVYRGSEARLSRFP